MPGTLDKLARWFHRHSLPCQRDDEHGQLRLAFNHPDGKVELVIRQIDDGTALLEIVRLETVTSSDDSALLALAWSLFAIGFARDPVVCNNASV